MSSLDLNPEGKKLFDKMNRTLRRLRNKVIETTEIWNTSPSQELTRARSSVKYYSKLLEQHDIEVEERIEKIRKEAAEKKEKKERDLREAEEKLKEQEKNKPRRVLLAESELKNHIEDMLALLPLPRNFFPELGESPPLQPNPLTQSSSLHVEKELDNMRFLAQHEAKERETKRYEQEEKQRLDAIKRLEVERQIQEEQERKRHDERRQKELESRTPLPPPPPPKSIHSSCASESEDEEQFLRDLEERKQKQRELFEQERLRKLQAPPRPPPPPPAPPAPPPAPLPKPKKLPRACKSTGTKNLYEIPDD